jgi:hypothetical protein
VSDGRIYQADRMVDLDAALRLNSGMASDVVEELITDVLRGHRGVDFTRRYGYLSFNRGGIFPVLRCVFLPTRPLALPNDWHEIPSDVVRGIMFKVDMSNPEKKTHALLAKGIVDMHRLHPGKHDLGAQIEGVLEYVRGDERAFWRDAIEGAIEVCKQQDKREAAAVLQALLDSEAASK